MYDLPGLGAFLLAGIMGMPGNIRREEKTIEICFPQPANPHAG
jgi:hypothetical protein